MLHDVYQYDNAFCVNAMHSIANMSIVAQKHYINTTVDYPDKTFVTQIHNTFIHSVKLWEQTHNNILRFLFLLLLCFDSSHRHYPHIL